MIPLNRKVHIGKIVASLEHLLCIHFSLNLSNIHKNDSSPIHNMSLFFVALSLLKKDKNQSWKLGQEEVEVKSSIQNLPSNIQFLPKDQRPTV